MIGKDQNITQRRGVNLTSPSSSKNGTASSSLPLTINDVDTSGKRRRKRRFGLGTSPSIGVTVGWGAIVLLSIAFLLMILAGATWLLGITSPLSWHTNQQIESEYSSKDGTIARGNRALSSANHGSAILPLDRFPTLSFALKNSDLVALYFAAHWCPMSTPVSLALDDAFGSHDLLMPTDAHLLSRGKKSLSIVYVSSDKTEHEYQDYIQNRNWIPVPFESPEKRQLKQHFSTCARIELKDLNIDRKHEIPTIIVIDSATQGIITTNGANDVGGMGDRALEHWMEMQTWVRESALGMTMGEE